MGCFLAPSGTRLHCANCMKTSAVDRGQARRYLISCVSAEAGRGATWMPASRVRFEPSRRARRRTFRLRPSRNVPGFRRLAFSISSLPRLGFHTGDTELGAECCLRSEKSRQEQAVRLPLTRPDMPINRISRASFDAASAPQSQPGSLAFEGKHSRDVISAPSPCGSMHRGPQFYRLRQGSDS